MKKFANLYLGLVFLVLYLPIFYLIGYAFNAGNDMNSFTGFSLSHFKTMFGDGRLMLIVTQTFFLRPMPLLGFLVRMALLTNSWNLSELVRNSCSLPISPLSLSQATSSFLL